MKTTFRQYQNPDDYQRISQFLIRHHQPGNLDGNWLEPVWEYMHGHPQLDRSSMEKIRIWESDGQIVGVVHYESRLGEAFFQFHPAYRHLREEMLDYAEANLTGKLPGEARNCLWAFVNHDDEEMLALVKRRGYLRDASEDRPLSKFIIPQPFPPIPVADGFRLTSLAEECDWSKVHRVLWRGFNHPGEPPAGEEELESRRKMFDTTTSSRDLKIAVRAPNGEFAAFCGMFYQPNARFAYVEPVATNPDYRRLGLGKAAVLEGIRRCAELGAEVAYVGSNQAFYLALGFQVINTSQCWVKSFD